MKKLIRDKIPEIVEANGRKLNFHVAYEYEMPFYSLEKVKEELQEVIASVDRRELLEEIADLYEALDKYVESMDFSRMEVDKAREEKIKKAGAFNNNYILTKEKN